jgi:nanoRNase/pAp phosphatase (c-di-AMP/oligoRNAs hydrolase)
MARRSAESEPPSCTTTSRRSDWFLNGLRNAKRVTFVSHIHPDPDSIGSMMGLAHLVQSIVGCPTRLTRDGPVCRAENRAMVEVLDLDLLPVNELTWSEGDSVVMVDSQPNTGRHSFDHRQLPIYGVIDHHDTPGEIAQIPFVDIRTNVGATCSLVTKYLSEQNVQPTVTVATGLLYGIETEIGGYPRDATPLDDEALHLLYPIADQDLLARIRNARLPHCHFECLLQALQSSFIYDRLILSLVPHLPQPDLAAEIADFMLRFERVDWAVCVGVYKNSLILSARTTKRGAKAGEVLQQVVSGLGKAGGHDRRAGGCVPLPSTSQSAIEEMQSEIRRRLLKALHIDCRGQRLVRLREILQHLPVA